MNETRAVVSEPSALGRAIASTLLACVAMVLAGLLVVVASALVGASAVVCGRLSHEHKCNDEKSCCEGSGQDPRSHESKRLVNGIAKRSLRAKQPWLRNG